MAARSLLDKCPGFIDQAVMADFINDCHFSQHIRKMRILYSERREALRAAIQDEAAGLLELDSADAGLHVLAWLPEGVDDGIRAKLRDNYGISVAGGQAQLKNKIIRISHMGYVDPLETIGMIAAL